MNILFLLKTLDMGGVEVVTTTLANCFADKGHRVAIFAFKEIDYKKSSVKERLISQVQVFTQHSLECNADNINALRKIMRQQQTQIVINQWGLPYFVLKTGVKAAKGMNVQFISVYHNTPDMNGRLQSIDNQLSITNNSFKRCFLHTKRFAFKIITAQSMRWCYNHSDKYMVLSPSFVQKFIDYTGIKDSSKLLVQTNPVTIDTNGFIYNDTLKQKEVIFVGRLDFYQKKVNRVIDTWTLLENRFPDWRLTIVGDGPDRINVEQQVKNLGLKHVSFEGFQKPLKYYKRASMLILTSEFEGFPLVLAEAMSFGVVPAVYNSYAAASDIVKDGVNGLLIPYNNQGFNPKVMANCMAKVMRTSSLLEKMAKQAVQTSKGYTIDAIYKQWITKINEIK